LAATVTVFSGRRDHTLTIPSSQPRYYEIKETYANIANSFTREHAFEAGLQVFHSAIRVWTGATDIWTINEGLATPVTFDYSWRRTTEEKNPGSSKGYW